MAKNMGILVPSNVVKAGGNRLSRTFVAGAALSPAQMVIYGAGVERVIVAPTASLVAIGVSDVNYSAIADEQDPMTHAYATGEKVPVIMDGMVVVVADTGGITAGQLAMTGSAVAGTVKPTAGSVWEPQMVGRCLTTAAATAKLVMKLF